MHDSEEYRLKLEFLLILILLMVSMEIILKKNYSIIVIGIIIIFIVFMIIFSLFPDYEILNKSSVHENKISIKYKLLGQELYLENIKDVFKNQLIYLWKNYRITSIIIVIAIILTVFEPILYFSRRTYGLAEWISGVGSLSAALVALYPMIHKSRPHVGSLKYCDPNNNTIIIQLFNTSEVPVLLRLKTIYMINGNSSKEVPLTIDFNAMAIFHRIDDKQSCAFILSDRYHNQFVKSNIVIITQLLNKFKNQHEYNILSFNFSSLHGNYIKHVRFRLGYDLERKE